MLDENSRTNWHSLPFQVEKPTLMSWSQVVQNGKFAVAWAVLAGAIVWGYAYPFWGLALRWWKEADYGHGFFVPVFSAVLLVIRWKDYRKRSFEVTNSAFLMGLALIGVAWLCRYISYEYYVRLLEPASLLPALAGMALLIGGWNGLGWSWPAIAFLIFMIPLPGALADLLRHPLQRMGTVASTYLLQLIGVPAIARGNVIVLTEGELGVVEACSGLRMMVLFFAVCVGAAFLVRRPLLDKILMVISAPLIAVGANIFRITLTGILHEFTSAELADFVFHDLAGWLMAPVALGLLSAELWWLDKVLVPVPSGASVLVVEGSRRTTNPKEVPGDDRPRSSKANPRVQARRHRRHSGRPKMPRD